MNGGGMVEPAGTNLSFTGDILLLSRAVRDDPEPWVHEHGGKPHPNTSFPEHVGTSVSGSRD